MDALIAFWRAKLKGNLWLMSHEDRAMIEQTIRALQELRKSRVSNQVQREADLVRTVKQLEQVARTEPGKGGRRR